MRLSILVDDPGYNKDAGHYDVYFKGIILRNVITADEEKRQVLCYVLDDRGKPIAHPDRPGSFLTEVKSGEVHIELKERALAARSLN